MATMTPYQSLLVDFTPRPIRNRRTYNATLRQLDRLMNKPRLTRPEQDMLDLLAVLIEQYESAEYPTPSVPPDRMLAHLIEAKGVRAADVAKATGIHRSTLSAVLAGRRSLSKGNVVKLAEYFGVSPAVFLDDGQ